MSGLSLDSFKVLADTLKVRAEARKECERYMEDYRFYSRCLKLLRKNNAHKKLIAKVTEELDRAELYYEYFSSRC